jgi:release factor glutamine methyltransferase
MLQLQPQVRDWEPHSALFVPDDEPLLFYKKIARFGKTHLLPGGMLLVETHQSFTQQAVAQFQLLYPQVVARKDMSGNDRMIMVS